MSSQQDQVSATLSVMSTALDPSMFANKLVNDVVVFNFKISVGSTSAIPPNKLDDLWVDNEPISLMIDLNNIKNSIASLKTEIGAVGKRLKGVSTDYLSKIWSIDTDKAKRTIDVTSQLCKHGETDHLRRQFSTNDRMLRYKRINTHFFMDIFCVTKAGTSSRKHKHMQLFVSDTGCMYVVLMKSKTEIVQAVEQFVKEIRVSTTLILDPEGTQSSTDLKKTASEMNCTLKYIKRESQWANLAELYIDFIKESIHKDLKDLDSPLVFCDHCAERRALINNLTAKNLFQ